MEYVVLCFRAPEPGKVLKHLEAQIGAENAAKLYGAFLDDALELTQEAGVRRIIGASPSANHPFFQDLSKRVYIEMADIGEGHSENPGPWIKKALEMGSKKNAKKTLYWDGTAPGVSQKSFKEIYTRLEKVDFVFGPAMNYSTYAIASKGRNPSFLDNIHWDTPKEFSSLANAAESENATFHIHSIYPRVKKARDIPYFIMHLKQTIKTNTRLARHTRKVLESLNLF